MDGQREEKLGEELTQLGEELTQESKRNGTSETRARGEIAYTKESDGVAAIDY